MDTDLNHDDSFSDSDAVFMHHADLDGDSLSETDGQDEATLTVIDLTAGDSR